jgi:hypothetical protein
MIRARRLTEGTMNTARNLLSSLSSRGVKVRSDAGTLRVGARRGALTTAEVDQLNALKDDILLLLEEARSVLQAPIGPRPAGHLVPLSPGQRCTLGLSLEKIPQSVRVCAVVARISGALNSATLAQAVSMVTARHESLRTRFVFIDGVPWQHIDEPELYRLNAIDLSETPADAMDETIQRLAEQFVAEKFELETGPIFAARLYRFSDREHTLLFGVSHVVSDGMSLQIIHREIWALYHQMTQGMSASLPAPALQYTDCCHWLEQTRDAWSLLHEAYLRTHLGGAPRPVIPISAAAGVERSRPMAGVHELSFGESLSRALLETAKRERALPAMVGLAVYLATMANWLQQSDLTVIFVYHGRDRPEFEDVTGLMVQHLYLRLTVEPGETLQQLVRRVSAEYLAAVEHQDHGRLPFIVPECATDLYFNWAPVDWGQWSSDASREDADITVRAHSFRKPVAMKLWCYFAESAAGITCRVEYRRDLLSLQEVEGFGRALLEQAQQL